MVMHSTAPESRLYLKLATTRNEQLSEGPTVSIMIIKPVRVLFKANTKIHHVIIERYIARKQMMDWEILLG